MYTSASASNAAASIRRAPSRQISSSADAGSPRVDSSVTTLNTGVSFLAGAPTPAARF
jgi:hypothetical protein